MRQSGYNTRQGFTLIEVLIALAIFSMIAAGTATAVMRGLSVKKKVEKEWESHQAIRATLTIMTQDISLAFHKSKTQGLGFQTPERDKWFKSFFVGKSKELNFTSLSHRKQYENTHESELCEIGYQLQEKNLLRRLSTSPDADYDKGGKTQVLLENVENIEFRYYMKSKNHWYDHWDFEHSDYRDKFPEAVEVILTRHENAKKITVPTKIKVQLPKHRLPEVSP